MGWIQNIIAGVAGFLFGHATPALAAGTSQIANPVDATQGLNTITIGTWLAPALLGFMYVILGVVAIGVFGFMIWAFMQIFAEKYPGRQV